mgnify:CR=1 FL=1
MRGCLSDDRFAAVGAYGDDLHGDARLPLDELHVAFERLGELLVAAVPAQVAFPALELGVELADLLINKNKCTDSNYAAQYNLPGTFAPIADYELLESAVNTVREKGLTVRAGNVLTSDVFYNDDPTVNDRWRKMGVLAVEMEAAALYMNAARAGKKALCMLTISDHLYKDEKLSARERQLGFDNMIQIALDM